MAFTLVNLVVLTILWEVLYVLLTRLVTHVLTTPTLLHRHIPETKRRAVLIAQAPSYLLSLIHALFVTPRGLNHLRVLFRASIPLKLILQPSPHEPLQHHETERVVNTNVVLASYLLADLYHVVRSYPTLGSLDTILHHLVFLYCALVAGYYNLFPFMFSWLILGEASTIFLNLRWFLIRAGFTSSPLLSPIQFLFALTFFLTRFALYAVGLAYHFEIFRRAPPYVPRWVVYTTTSVVVIGFFINLAWLSRIYRIAFANNHRNPSSPPPPAPSSQPSASKTH